MTKFQIGNVVMYRGQVTKLTGDDFINILKGGEQPEGILLDGDKLLRLGFVVPSDANKPYYYKQLPANHLKITFSPTYGYRDSKYDKQFKYVHEVQNFVREVFGEELVK